MKDTQTSEVNSLVSQAVLDEIRDLFLGLSYVLQTEAKEISEDKNLRASLYFQPLDSKYYWVDDTLRCTKCHSVSLAAAILKLLIIKSKEIPDPKGFVPKSLKHETSRLLAESSFEELDRVVGLVLPDLLKLYEPVKGSRAPDGLKIKALYKYRAQNCIDNRGRWFRKVARIIYRYHLGRSKRDVRDGFALVQIWG